MKHHCTVPFRITVIAAAMFACGRAGARDPAFRSEVVSEVCLSEPEALANARDKLHADLSKKILRAGVAPAPNPIAGCAMQLKGIRFAPFDCRPLESGLRFEPVAVDSAGKTHTLYRVHLAAELPLDRIAAVQDRIRQYHWGETIKAIGVVLLMLAASVLVKILYARADLKTRGWHSLKLRWLSRVAWFASCAVLLYFWIIL